MIVPPVEERASVVSRTGHTIIPKDVSDTALTSKTRLRNGPYHAGDQEDDFDLNNGITNITTAAWIRTYLTPLDLLLRYPQFGLHEY